MMGNETLNRDVLLRELRRKGPDLFALVHIREALEHDLHRPVDLIPYSRTMNEFLKNRIRDEAEYV